MMAWFSVLLCGSVNLFLRFNRIDISGLQTLLQRLHRWGNVLMTMYEKAKVFTLEAGKVIVVITITL